MRFLIIATTRSGTMYLTSCLNSHPDLKCHGEEPFAFCRTLGHREGANLKYTEHETMSDADRAVRAVVLPGDDLSEFHVIHMVRRNLLELSISKLMNANKGVYKRPAHVYKEPKLAALGHIFADTDPESPRMRKIAKELPISTVEHMDTIREVKLPVDTRALTGIMRDTSATVLKWKEILRRRAGSLLTVRYEDLTGGRDCQAMPEARAREVLEFLGVPVRPLLPSMHKVNDPDYSAYVSNWDEVQRCERGLCQEYAEAIAG